ncbi:MAG: inositol monophosphatase [Elusimicrobiota bacterium]|jgi:myo-inositol-1(or 4)-monophosphatase|nr:inositol monophosphatase [Elusimicrobiota bacterium]
MQLSNYANTALKAAKVGANILMKYYGKNLNIEYKSAIDPVSQADKNSQKKIISIIKKDFPDHGILAEEDGVSDTQKEFCWIIDPLDGTVNFVHSLPQFCVSIGLKYKKEIIMGVIYAPVINELFIAQKGKGAFFNGKRIRTSKNTVLNRAIGVTGFPYQIKGREDRIFSNFRNVALQVQGVRRLGSAALDMAWTACGRLDFFWEETLKAWDIAAGVIIVKEAGGIVSDYKGGKDYLYAGNEGTMIAASNKKIHKQILNIINNEK